ncbi:MULTISPECIES: 6-phosphogluconolactonase [unclassified Thiomonas]|jgi:6-phosphogluconolactonase|uniref:6-phosphogluconolactonase n=1 Tax=unclassified Thiomonas TaxID=2625466 RepID=UPI0004DBB239|nr:MULTISPECIES: 6-phosphogluconolactonase [unclassified Thiomonas]MDD5000273.1 6-phosphogluconolactonase [Thiomonas arsenitoxydans]CQR41777.1 putative 6-phosphogluconolactonase [Thiomonas sp. CB3]CDW95216.1 putative 6-phosphogluconolactonase [Thiomonas sp. CB2]VDY03752.1 putative 6-phosphogluconolactonase [Thiomonas sp. Bio17B3]VDY09071.1 putative 6-phosphogluconolactonase [Thiomonas sp. Sup16B3]
MLHLCTTPQEQIDRLVRVLIDALAQDIAQRGRAVLAVSGGRSPIPLFQALARAPIDWPRVTLTLVDERLVPPDHADSNAALVRAHLLTGAAAQARFLPLVDDASDLAGCVDRANAQFRALAQPLTAALLGMGDDGHTASLFPRAAELPIGLSPDYALPYLAVTPPHAAHMRISLSLAALLGAGRLLLSISGETKRAVYARASEPPPSPHLPIGYLIQQSKTPFDAYWSA